MAFFGKIVDSLCGQADHAPVTMVFTLFVDPSNCVQKRLCSPVWTEEKPFELSKQVNNFRKLTSQIFERYQASTTGISKWYALSLPLAPIRQVEGLEYLDAGVFESVQKTFKTKLKENLQKRNSEMSEFLVLGTFESFTEHIAR